MEPERAQVLVPEQLNNSPPAYSPEGVDLTLVRWMLSLTPATRLAWLESAVDSCGRLRGAATNT